MMAKKIIQQNTSSTPKETPNLAISPPVGYKKKNKCGCEK